MSRGYEVHDGKRVWFDDNFPDASPPQSGEELHRALDYAQNFQREVRDVSTSSFLAGVRWQAARQHADESDALKVAGQRIAELEAKLNSILARDEEVRGECEGWWIGGAWGDYGEVVVPLRILSYVIDGELDQKIVETDPGFAVTYAEQVARAEKAEAKLAKIRELCAERVSGYPDDPYDFVREFALRVLAILDGEADDH